MKSKNNKNQKLIIDQKVSWKKVITFIFLTYTLTFLLCGFVYKAGKKLDPELPAIHQFSKILQKDEAAVARYLEVHPELSGEDLPTFIIGKGGEPIDLNSLEERVAVYVSQKHLGIQAFGAMMIFPALVAIFLRLIFAEGFKNSGFRFGKFKNYIIMLITIAGFVFLSVLANALIFGKSPDWYLSNMGINELTLVGDSTNPLFFWIFQFAVVGLIANLTFPIVMMFGEEYGWRSYLFQKLLPLGFHKANLITNLVWGLWHAPIILMGYNYGPSTIVGVFMFLIIIFFVGTLFNYMYVRGNSVILTSVGHGWFNGLVPSVILLTGFMGKETVVAPLGLVGIVILVIMFLVAAKLTKNFNIESYIEN